MTELISLQRKEKILVEIRKTKSKERKANVKSTTLSFPTLLIDRSKDSLMLIVDFGSSVSSSSFVALIALPIGSVQRRQVGSVGEKNRNELVLIIVRSNEKKRTRKQTRLLSG